METNQGVQRWEDIVFENRNKSYGAYAIRKGYHNNVLRSGMFCIVVLSFALFVPKSSINELKEVIKNDPGTFLQTLDPKIIPVERKPEVKPPPKPKSTGFAFTLTTEMIPDDSVAGTSNTPATGPIDHNATDPGTEPSSTGTDVEVSVAKEEPWVRGAEIMPSYEGGFSEMMKFLKNKLRYPSRPSHMGIEGTVYVSFVVGKDGNLSYVEVIKGVDPDLDREAIRVISMMTGWKSGMQNKMPVAVKMVLPIKFSLGR